MSDNVFVGVDLHSTQSTIAIVDNDGNLIKSGQLPNYPDQILDFLQICPSGTQVGIEATRNWHWLYDLLLDNGLSVKLGNPYQLSLNAKLKKKTDRLDAAFIANTLRVNMFPEVQAVTNYERQLLELVRARKSFVKQQTQIKNRVSSQLGKYNLRSGLSDNFSSRGIEWIKQQTTDSLSSSIISHNLELLEEVRSKIREFDSKLEEYVKEDLVVQALIREIPGVGIVTASTLRAVIGRIERFPSAKKLCAYVGIVPGTFESNGKVRHGHITRMGNGELRALLVESAHSAKIHNQYSREFWERVAKKRGSKIAYTALARKLLTKVYYVWKNLARTD